MKLPYLVQDAQIYHFLYQYTVLSLLEMALPISFYHKHFQKIFQILFYDIQDVTLLANQPNFLHMELL